MAIKSAFRYVETAAVILTLSGHTASAQVEQALAPGIELQQALGIENLTYFSKEFHCGAMPVTACILNNKPEAINLCVAVKGLARFLNDGIKYGFPRNPQKEQEFFDRVFNGRPTRLQIK